MSHSARVEFKVWLVVIGLLTLLYFVMTRGGL
jgi:hypothetical protein